jgi:hypothetical protein
MKTFTLNASKAFMSILFCILAWIGSVQAQIGVTVTGNTNTTPNLAASYTSLANAVTALNGVTAMTGPVTFTLAAGTSETAPVKGFNISTSTAGVLNATNTLTIVKAPGAATVINAGVGTANGPAASPDGMMYLSGSDYVTINGITFNDGNTTNATVTMEFGIAFFKRAAGDGCNNNSVQNCVFNMQRINNAAGVGPMTDGSCAIQVLNSTAAAATTGLTPTNGGTLATNGTNSNNTFYSNQINGGNHGIVLSGFAATVGVGPAPTATTFLGDLNNIVGAPTLGNTILNFGGAVAATNPAAGIRANNQWSVSIRSNTIDNNNGSGVNHAFTLRGIFAQAGTSANATVSNNTVTVRSGATTSALTAIENGIGSTAAANTVNINDNTIRFSYTTATSGVFTAVSNSSSAATLNINTNNIQQLGSTNYPSTGTIPVIVVGSPGVVNVTNNTISNFNMTSATGGTLRGITASTPTGLYTVTGNTIENLRYSTATSTGSITGIYNLLSATLQNVNSNIIRNFSTPTTGTLNGIQNNTTAGTFQCRTNQIYNFTTTAGGVGGFSANGITWSNANVDISGNIIYAINSTGSTGGTGGVINGITFSGTATVTRNAIYDLSSNSTNAVINGINVAATGTNAVNNNLIGDLRAPNSTGTIAISGILVGSGTTNNIFHNTVNIAATTTSATSFGSSAIYFSSGTPVNNLRNNIFVNTSAPGPTGGFTAAIRYTAAPTSTNFPAANNNNLYWVGTPAANRVIYGEGVVTPVVNGQQTLALYKTYINTTLPVSGRESASVSENPLFTSTVGSNPITTFLRYNTGTALQLEQGGNTSTGITTDYTGTTVRCPGGGCPGTASTPDIGAWELNGTPSDLNPPSVSFTALSNSTCITDVSLSATITDGSGVNGTPGTRPRLYYKKSTDANAIVGNTSGDNGWKYVEATNGASPFSFTTDYSLLQAAVAPGDIIQYFVVAQDNATIPNVGITNGSFAAGQTSVALASGAAPIGAGFNSYTVITGIPTTVTIGAAGTYPSLTGAGGLFATLNASGLAGNTVANIIDASVTETGVNALNQVAYGCTGFFTLTIKPSATSTLTGAVTGGQAMIRLNGADNVIIDGSNSGGTDRSLTITNTATVAGTSAIALISLGANAGATANTIRNCNLSTGSSAANTYGISVGGTLPGSTGADNDNVTIQNNNITAANIGIYAKGTTSVSAGGMNALTVSSNTITLNATATLTKAIQVGGGLSALITLNTIDVQTSGTTAPVGISLEADLVSSTITRNNITRVLASATGGYGGRGITVGTGLASSNLVIANNMVSGVNGSNWSSFGNSSSMGIGIGMIGESSTLTTTTGGVNLYYNSVSMAGSMGVSGTARLTTALFIGSGASSLDIRNNIFVNNMLGTNINQFNYGVYSEGTNAAFTTINYNDYFVSNSFNPPSANVGYIGGSNRLTFANWQSASAQDANSVNADPSFTSASDLHLVNNLANFNNLDGKATPIGGVPNDFDGDLRNGTTPDLGADEYTANICASDPTGGSTAPTVVTAICGSGTRVINLTGQSSGVGIDLQWEYSTNGGANWFDVVGGSGATTASYTTASITVTTQFRVRVTCTNVPFSGTNPANSSVTTITVNPLPTPTINPTPSANYCSPNGARVTLTGSGTGTYVWDANAAATYTNMFTTLTGGTAYSGGNQTAVYVEPTVSRTYRLTITDVNGCTASATQAVNVIPGVTISSFTAPTATICPSTTFALDIVPTVVGSNGAGNYTFSSSTTGSLDNLASGTYLFGPAGGPFDTQGSTVTPIGFNFSFAGTTYSHFSANSNGQMELHTSAGATAIGTTTLTGPAANRALLFAMAGDNEVATGIRYLLSGTPGNQKLVVEFVGFYANWNPNLINAGNMQIWLDEATGRIDYVYGEIFNSLGSSVSKSIGLSNNNTTGNAGYVTVGASPTFTSATTFVTNSFAAGSGTTTGSPLIANLGSATNGSRVQYTFNPPAPVNFTYAWTAQSPADINDLGIGNVTTTNIANPVAGEGSNGVLQNPSAPGADIYSYQVVVTNTGNGCSASRTAQITVQQNLLVALAPTASTTSPCIGSPSTLTGTNRFSGGCLPYTYTWKANGTPIADYVSAAGATSSGANITVGSTANLLPGMLVEVTAGTGAFPAGTRVSSITSSTVFAATLAPTTPLSGGAVVTGRANGIVGLPSTVNTLTVTPTAATTYTLEIQDNDGQIQEDLTGVTITPLNAQPLTTNAATRCGVGTTQLTGTVNVGDQLVWYTAPTGGTYLGAGSPVTSPTISTTTTFYAAAVTGGALTNVGPTSPTAQGGTIATQTVDWNVNFTTLSATVIQSVTIFPMASGQSGVIFLRAGTGSTVLTSVNYTTSVSGGATPQVVPLNFVISTPGSYNLYTTLPTSGVRRNNSGQTYPVTSPVANITGNGFDNTYWMGLYNWVFLTGCEGTRVPVVANVNAPPALALSANQTVCNNVIATLSVTTGGGSFNTFTWLPVTNLFSDAACTVPYVAGTSATTVYARSTTAGSTTYTVTATETGGAQCVNTATTTLSIQPNVTGVTPTSSQICNSGTVTMTLTPGTGYAAGSILWERSTTSAVAGFSTLSGETNPSYTTPTISTGPEWFRVSARNSLGVACPTSTFTIPVTVVNAFIVSSSGATRCGTGTVNLTATPGAGTTVNWYSSPTGGTALQSSITPGALDTYTPTVSGSTTFYASAVGAQSNFNVGLPDNLGAYGSYGTPGVGDYSIRFSTTKAVSLNSITVYPQGTGNLTIVLANAGSSTPIQSFGPFTIVTGQVNTPVLLNLNASIPTPGNYQLYAQTVACGRYNPYSGPAYPFNSPDGSVSIYASSLSATGTNSTTLYYLAFNLSFSAGCESPRVAVPVTVNPAPAITVSSTPVNGEICAGSSALLNVTSSNPGYTYVWTPGPISGPTVSVGPVSTTVYTVTATDNTAGPFAGCAITGTRQVVVNPLPLAPTLNVSPPGAVCGGTVKTLTGSATTSGVMNFGNQASLNTASTGAAGYPGPYSVYYGGQRMQMLIRASELTSNGFVAGSNLTSIAFTVATIGADYILDGANANFQMSIGHTALAALAANDFQTGLTQVVAPGTFTATVGQNVHTFSSPFTWNGTSNVIIETTFSNNLTGNAANLVASYYSTTGYTSCIVYRADGVSAATAASATTTSFTYNARPDFVLNGTTVTTNITWAPVTNLFNDLPATSPYVSNNPQGTVFARLDQSGPVTATFTIPSTGCSNSTTANLVYNPRPTADVSANDFVCEGQNAPISIFLTGTGPWNLTYTDNGTPTTVNGIATSPYNFTYANATIARNYVVTALVDSNCTSEPSDLDALTINVPIPCSITWNGSQPGQSWNNANNWTPNNSAPSPQTSVIIPGNVPQPIVGAVANCADVNLQNSLPSVGLGQTLNIRGSISGSGNIAGEGKVALSGTGLQTISGIAGFSNLEIANTSAQGVVIAPTGQIRVTPTQPTGSGLLTFLNNSRLTTNGNLFLMSNANGTAKIGPVPVNGSGVPTIFLTGEVTQQRFMPGWTGGWTMIGSPMSGKNFTDWVDNFKVIGPPGTYGTQGSGIINLGNSAHGTILKLDEPTHDQVIDTVQRRGWKFPASTENIVPGKGYRTFISISGSSFTNRIFDNKGTVTMGTFNWTGGTQLTRNELSCAPVYSSEQCNSVSDRGWNLLANPFPCDVDWDATSGTNLTDGWQKPATMLNAAYRYNASGIGGAGLPGYGFYAGNDSWYGSLPAPANPRYLPASQGFFVRLALGGTYNANMTIRESAKSINVAGNFLRTNTNSSLDPRLRLELTKANDNSGVGFRGAVRFMADATDGYDPLLDFPSLGGPGFSFGFPIGPEECVINSAAPVTAEKVVPMFSRFSDPNGNYVFKVASMDNFEGLDVFLRDKFENVIVDLRLNPEYVFNVSPLSGAMEARFELIFAPSTVTRVVDVKGADASVNVIPNPSNQSQKASLIVSGFDLHSNARISVMDALGRIVYAESLTIDKPGSVEHELTSDLPAGIYTVRISDGKKTFSKKWVIR